MALVITLVLFTMLMELSIYLIQPQCYYKKDIPTLQYDEKYLLRHPLNADITKCINGKTINFKTNNEGFRSNYNWTIEKEKKRIITLGDSFMVGNDNLQEHETYPAQLQKLVGKEWEVMNMGTGAFGTLQELELMKEYAPKYRPDIIILGFYVNDIGITTLRMANMFNQQEINTIGENEQVIRLLLTQLTQVPTIQEIDNSIQRWKICCLEKRDIKEAVEPKYTNKVLMKHSQIYNIIKNKKQLIKSNREYMNQKPKLKSLINLGKKEGELERHLKESLDWFFYKNYLVSQAHFWIYQKQYDFYQQVDLKLTEYLLKEMNMEAGEINATLIIMLIPSEMQTNKGYQGVLKEYYGESGYDLDMPNRYLEDISEKYGIQYINIKEGIQEKEMKKMDDPRDTHWSSWGAKKSAKITYEYMKEEMII